MNGGVVSNSDIMSYYNVGMISTSLTILAILLPSMSSVRNAGETPPGSSFIRAL